jgi:Asp-tRNA(Asn)/Glu-tRNA(Gln) amidotransferase A subunit family amidase
MIKNKTLLLACLAGLSQSIYPQLDRFNAYVVKIPKENISEKVSIAIKDNIDLVGFPTTAGSLAMTDNFPSQNAFIVSKLQENNYFINGKTNLSEWANFRSEKSVSGWSSYGGQTLNPNGINLNPCGSSSGSAVAVAAGLVDVAVGTETNGSISCPASVNGIVGHKPTVGLLSRTGIIPISSTQDTAGPMGKSVEIVAEALQAMAGTDKADSATLLIPNNFEYDFISNLKQSVISGKRFGLLKSGEKNTEAAMLLERLTKLITKLGGIVVEIDDSRVYPAGGEYFLLLYEFRVGLENYLLQSSSRHKTLKSLVDFNLNNAEKIMPHFEQEIFYKSLSTIGKDKEYQKALAMVAEVRNEFNDLLKNNNLDTFIGLTRNPAWQIDYEGGDDAAMANQVSYGNGAYAAIAGYPHLTIPLASINNLPVGVSLIGPAWSDAMLLQIGYELEKNKESF